LALLWYTEINSTPFRQVKIMSTGELSIEVSGAFSDIQMQMLQFVAKGSSISAAATALGIHRSTVYIWRNTVSGFSDALKQAEGLAELHHTLVLHSASVAGDWRASQFWLSRRRREMYGDNIDLDIDRRITALLAKLEPGSKTETTESADAEGRTEVGSEEGTDNASGSQDSNP
jgi:hypothetical protein